MTDSHPKRSLRTAKIDTQVIHGGQRPEPITGAIMPPIVTSATFLQQSPGVHKGFEYSRSHNPTRYAFERLIATLEGSPVSEDDDPSRGGIAFASGMAATATILDLLTSGDRVVAMDDLYGGTRRLFEQVRRRSQNLKFVFANLADSDDFAAAMTPDTKMVWVETPTNPMMKLADLGAIAEIARRSNPEVLLVCDNTFATPYNQRPLEYDFDLVMHSTTKYLNGHSDVVGGAVVARNAELAKRMRFHQNAAGAVMGPFDAYQTLRGAKTLSLRMERHASNAQRIAEYLERHSSVARVIYPGLPSYPQYELACRQMKTAGGMISFVLRGGIDEAREFLEHLSLFQLAESLGAVESLVNHPAIMTHASVPPETRAALGIDDSLIRLSVGIEDVDDLLESQRHGDR